MSSGGRISRISSCVQISSPALRWRVSDSFTVIRYARLMVLLVGRAGSGSDAAQRSHSWCDGRTRCCLPVLALRRFAARAGGGAADRAAERFEHLDRGAGASGDAVAVGRLPVRLPHLARLVVLVEVADAQAARCCQPSRTSICRGTARAARCVSSRSASRGGPLPCKPAGPEHRRHVGREQRGVRLQHEPGEVGAVRLVRRLQERPAGRRTPPAPVAASASSRRSAPSSAPIESTGA